MRAMNPARKRYFDYLESQGKLPRSQEEEEPGYYEGGEVEDSFDYMVGHAHEYDSSGEPHTEDKFEDEEPMEYMNRGGLVKKIAGGAKAPNSSFAKALRRAR